MSFWEALAVVGISLAAGALALAVFCWGVTMLSAGREED